MVRRAKIVCTLGPASAAPGVVRDLIGAGMDVARLNLSHGTHEEHERLCAAVREAAREAGRVIGVLADLQGPRIRLGRFAGGEATLETGSTFTLAVRPLEGDATRASTPYAGLVHDLRPGDTVLLDDGRVRLAVEAVAEDEVRTRVVEGGRVADHKGINLPGVRVGARTPTDKDLDDLRFVLSLPVDAVALSFVRSPRDADPAREAMERAGRRVPLIAKIERAEAVDDLESIVRAFDGIMVARGDLGVELPLEQVPLVQKRAVALGRAHGRPVIVATQMLDSMVERTRPTRAEVSDVANAVLDGADAVMLSAETSVGKHPVEAVATMARIAVAAEGSAPPPPPAAGEPAVPEEALAASATRIAQALGAVALAAFTVSGATARRAARHRPPIPVLAFTTRPELPGQLALTWGTEAFVVADVSDTDAMVEQVDRTLRDQRRGRAGDRVVILAGAPPGRSGSTNTIRVHRLGEA